jgi:hypothetical protein
MSLNNHLNPIDTDRFFVDCDRKDDMTYSVYDRWTVVDGKYALVYRNLSCLDADEEARGLNQLNDTKQKSDSYQKGVEAYWDGNTEVWNNPFAPSFASGFHVCEPQIMWELGFSEAEAEVTGTPAIPF